MSISVDIEIVCSNCGDPLKAERERSRSEDVKILVTPCECCLEGARVEGNDKGFDEGYDSGREHEEARRQ